MTLKIFCLFLLVISDSFAREATERSKETTVKQHISLTQNYHRDGVESGGKSSSRSLKKKEQKSVDSPQVKQQSYVDKHIIAGCTAVGAFGGYVLYHSLIGDVSSSISQTYTSMAWQTATDPGTWGGAFIGAFIGNILIREKNIAQGKIIPRTWEFLNALSDYTSETISYAIQTPTDWVCHFFDNCTENLKRKTTTKSRSKNKTKKNTTDNEFDFLSF